MVQDRDDSWFILASKELSVTESVLRDYAAHDNSLSLAILIHVTCQQFNHVGKSSWPSSWVLLKAASKIDTQDTSPNCATSSVHSGMKLFSKCRVRMMVGWHFLSWDRFAKFTSLYIEILILLQHTFPLLLTTGYHSGAAILVSAMQCPWPCSPQSASVTISHTACVMTLPQSLLMLPFPMHLPHLYLLNFTLRKASQMCDSQRQSNLPIRQSPIASTFLPLPRIQLPPR